MNALGSPFEPQQMSPSSSARRNELSYWLRPHIHVCVTKQGAVFLDLVRDRYFGLSLAQSSLLSEVVAGCPTVSSLTAFELDRQSASEQIAELLVGEGFLTRDDSKGKPAMPPDLHLGEHLVPLGTELPARLGIRIHHVACFLAACTNVHFQLRVRSLEALINQVMARKKRHIPRAPLNIVSTTALVSIFRYLRCFFFTAKGHCLFHGLALVNFLAHYQIFPTLVIGVQSVPFGAHCWVQQDCYLFDATPEEIRSFTPILAV